MRQLRAPSRKGAPPSLTGLQFLVQADQDLATVTGLADHAFELRDPLGGLSRATTHQLSQTAIVDRLASDGQCGVNRTLDVPRRYPRRDPGRRTGGRTSDFSRVLS